MITSQIVADSNNKAGSRLTTYILEYPRYIHAELLTHRVFSKNSASSRAIPTQKFIEEVRSNPAIPTHWGKNQSGMQANDELSLEEIAQCQAEWLHARDLMIASVERLNELGLHKQITNRLLEPWFHMRIILSGTEFANFFALRAHKDAHPDLQKLAFMMLDQYNESKPQLLTNGQWHIPFGDQIDETRLTGNIEEQKIQIAIARCARVSYNNFLGKTTMLPIWNYVVVCLLIIRNTYLQPSMSQFQWTIMCNMAIL